MYLYGNSGLLKLLQGEAAGPASEVDAKRSKGQSSALRGGVFMDLRLPSPKGLGCWPFGRGIYGWLYKALYSTLHRAD